MSLTRRCPNLIVEEEFILCALEPPNNIGRCQAVKYVLLPC